MQRMNSHAEFSFRSGQILNLQGGENRGIYELSMEDAMIKADFGRGISIIILLNAVEAAGGYSTEQTGNAEGNLYVMIFIHPSTACCLLLALVVVVMQVGRCIYLCMMQRREPSQSRCVWKRTCVSPLLHPSEHLCDRQTDAITNKAHPRKAITIAKGSYLQGTDNPWQECKEKGKLRRSVRHVLDGLPSVSNTSYQIYSARQAAKLAG